MKELRKLSEDKNTFVLNWEKSDIASEYIVEGMTRVFTYVPITRLNSCNYVCDKNPEFVGYRVAYVAKNTDDKYKELIVDTTNMITVETNLRPISIVTIKSANDTVSLSFRSEEIYDLYRLFNKNGELLGESEDCIIVLDSLAAKNCYVTGYKKTDNGYVLKGISEVTRCKPIQNIHAKKTILSIVIPVYNSTVFLVRTVQSILSSTFTDFEIILVDDGSQEPTRKLCDWYADNFDCIKVIHQENAGVCVARNRGMDEAKGEWLAFVDNDDIVHPYMYEKLYKTATTLGTDIAISQCVMREDYESYKNVLSDKINQNIIIMNSFKEVVESKGNLKNIYFVAIWNKIVKTSVARLVRFDENLLYYEDTAYTAPLYSFIDKFVLVKDAYYVWDKRKQKTEGTASNSHPTRPSELIWLHYYLSYASPLVIGNPDKEIAAVYKYDILQHLLSKYIEKSWSKEIKNVMRGTLKFFVRNFDMPVDRLKADKNNEKLYNAWLEIKESSTKEYNGIGDIPKEYYL